MTVGIGALTTVTPETPHLAMGLSFLGGLGVGGIIQPTIIVLTIVSPDEFIGTVAALNLSLRFVGGAIGYAICFYVFQNKLNSFYLST